MTRHQLKLTILILALSASPAAAQLIPTIIRTAATAIAPNGALNDLAYNDKAGVYLHVWGHPGVWGAFVSSDGVLIGAPFLIAAQSASDSFPRVAYSQASSDDVFWVTFTSELPAGRFIYSRLVRYVPTAAGFNEMGPIQPLSTAAGGPLQSAGGIAFDPSRRQFFATWDGITAVGWEAWGQVWQLSGSITAPTIGAVSAVLNISNAGNAQGTPNVAFDWQHNKYLVVYQGEHPSTDLINGAWARTVSFDGAMNASFSDLIRLDSSGGRPIEENVVYAPETDQFLTFWTDQTPGRNVTGRIVDHNGVSTPAGTFPILATGGNEGAADGVYNPTTRTILIAAMREQTKWIQGIMLTAAGGIIEYFQASSVVPTGPYESFYPQVAAAPAGRFALSYMNNFLQGYVDLLQAGVASPPGPSPGGGPPPPPPCAVEPLPSALNVSLTGVAQSRTISVTASTADCAWTATSSASWLTITAGASGAGPGTTTYAVTQNLSGANRSATVTIGSGRVTVVQAPSLTNAALHNISGARASDIMWHNVATGHVAVWDMEGWTVARAYYLTSTPVATSWKVVGSGDLNGDGFADVVWRHSSGIVAVWFVQNGATVGAQYLSLNGNTASETDPAWEIRAVGDLDGDGKCDIIWQNVATGDLGVWYMDGGTVSSVASFNVTMTDSNWKIAGAGDINLDGKADVIWQNHATGALAAWAMNGHNVGWSGYLMTMAPAPAGVSNTNWKICGVGDTNGDGWADLIWQNNSTGELGVWFLRYATVIEQRALTIPKVADTNWHVVGPG